MSDSRIQGSSSTSKPPRKPRRSVKTPERPAASEPTRFDSGASAPRVGRSAVDRDAMVATAAYFRAQRRNFAAGHELQDWLDAESEINAALLGELEELTTR